MKIITLILTICLSLLVICANADKIATVHSDFTAYMYKTASHDVASLGYDVEAFENVNIQNLINNINDYKLIIFNPVFNYTNSVDLSKYGKDIRKYVEAGGLVIITDLNYPPMTDWLSSIDQNLYWKPGKGVTKDQGAYPIAYVREHPLLANINPRFVIPWNDTEDVSPAIKPLLLDYNNHPIIGYAEYGKGIIVFSNSSVHYAFPSVQFVDNLIKWQKDPKRLEALNSSSEVEKVADTVYGKGKEPQKLDLHSVYGNKNVKTEATISSDTYNLNVSIKCYDDNFVNATRRSGKDELDVLSNDCVEVFVSTNGSDYYHFAVTPNNVRLDEKNGKIDFSTYWKSSVDLKSNVWTANISIPYVSIGINAKNPTNNIKLNLSRIYHIGSPEYALCSWANLKELAFSKVSNFGIINIEDKIPYEKFNYFDKLELAMPAQIKSSGNVFSFNVEDKNYTYKILDLCCDSFVNSQSAKNIPLEFKRGGIHQLQGLLYSNNTLVASTSVYTINVPDVIKMVKEYPCYRDIVQSKDPNKEMSVKLSINDKSYSSLLVDYKIVSDSGKVVNTGNMLLDNKEDKYIKYDLSKLAVGKYFLNINLKQNGKIIRTYKNSFKVLPPNSYEVTFDSKRLCYVNGKPYFPIILYHLGEPHINELNSTKKPGVKELNTEEVLTDVKDHGFNGGITFLTSDNEKHINEFKSRGLTITMELNTTDNKDFLKKHVDMLNKNSAGLFHYTVDEPMGDRLTTALNIYSMLSEIDPNRPIGAAVNDASIFKTAKNAFDIMMPDDYIIRHVPYEERASVATLKTFIDAAMEATDYTKPLWAVPQGFANQDPNSRFGMPTGDEIRCQAYFYIVNGATGFAWYSLSSPEPDPYDEYNIFYLPTKSIWQDFKVLNEEITKFSSVLYEGDSKGALKSDNNLVYSNYWQTKSAKYIIIVNPERKAQSVNLTLPSSGVLSDFFTGEKISTNNGILSLNMKMLECLVLKLN